MVIPGGKDFGPLPIFEMISGKHDVGAIEGHLKSFVTMMKKISTTKSVHKIETDFSLALLHACSLAFNSITQYLQLIHNITEKQNHDEINFVIIHICSSHLIRTVIRKSKKCFPNKKKQCLQRTSTVVGIFVGKLVHCDSVASATKIYESFVQIFGLPKKVKNFHSVCEAIRSYGSEREDSDSNNDDSSDFIAKIILIILIITMFIMVQRRNTCYRRKKRQRLQRKTLHIGKFFMRLK